TAVAAGGVLGLSGVGIGVAAAVGTGEWRLLGRSVLAALLYSPAMLVILGVAAAGYGLHRRLLAVASILLVFSGLTALFGEMLQLPDWAMAIAPWHHTPAYAAQSAPPGQLHVPALEAR